MDNQNSDTIVARVADPIINAGLLVIGAGVAGLVVVTVVEKGASFIVL